MQHAIEIDRSVVELWWLLRHGRRTRPALSPIFPGSRPRGLFLAFTKEPLRRAMDECNLLAETLALAATFLALAALWFLQVTLCEA